MGSGIPQGAAGASVAVLIYSFFCQTCSLLLVGLLLSYGENVTLLCSFTAISTVGSIIQKFHYAFAWEVIKQAQFDKAVQSLTTPALGLGGAAQTVDVVLFDILDILLVFILYKYMKTRRLLAGAGRRGGWWASGGSKERSRNRDIGAEGTIESGVTSNTQRSIYDRALVTRFTIGFVILAIFEIAIIVFSPFQQGNNTAITKSGAPNHTVSNTISDILFFTPGVTASLVVFLVFGTTKSWRQYRDLVVGGCGVKRRTYERRMRRSEEGDNSGGLEFERLPSLPDRTSGQRDQSRKKSKDIRDVNTPTGGRSPTRSPIIPNRNAQRADEYQFPQASLRRHVAIRPTVPNNRLTIDFSSRSHRSDQITRGGSINSVRARG
ncbi:uncharacterized protein PAC_11585 [Phialocephala subalpina]|uniref:Uncharacterized protein n=1 Tax=Phialocephala subalpina TaxID=576137 RepID=A0A1L7X9G9_9HELO|nr:uncharacterized protein PAC_11585 [Phialocephala subalpina]